MAWNIQPLMPSGRRGDGVRMYAYEAAGAPADYWAAERAAGHWPGTDTVTFVGETLVDGVMEHTFDLAWGGDIPPLPAAPLAYDFDYYDFASDVETETLPGSQWTDTWAALYGQYRYYDAADDGWGLTWSGGVGSAIASVTVTGDLSFLSADFPVTWTSNGTAAPPGSGNYFLRLGNRTSGGSGRVTLRMEDVPKASTAFASIAPNTWWLDEVPYVGLPVAGLMVTTSSFVRSGWKVGWL